MISITNEQGEKLARQVVGVGALAPGERHKYSFSVEVVPARPPANASAPDQRRTLPSMSMKRRNSARVLASARNVPTILLVTIDTPRLCTPRVVMH